MQGLKTEYKEEEEVVTYRIECPTYIQNIFTRRHVYHNMVSQNDEMAAGMLVSQISPAGGELFLFSAINFHSCWPREWKRSITDKANLTLHYTLTLSQMNKTELVSKPFSWKFLSQFISKLTTCTDLLSSKIKVINLLRLINMVSYTHVTGNPTTPWGFTCNHWEKPTRSNTPETGNMFIGQTPSTKWG